MQSREYKTNTGSIASYYNLLLTIYGITTDDNGLSKTSKAKWKKIVEQNKPSRKSVV